MSDWVFVCATGALLPGEKAVAWAEDTPILVVNRFSPPVFAFAAAFATQSRSASSDGK